MIGTEDGGGRWMGYDCMRQWKGEKEVVSVRKENGWEKLGVM